MELDEEMFGPRAIITISGIPKDGDTNHVRNVIRELSDVVQEELDDVEVGVVTNAPDSKLGSMLAEGEVEIDEDTANQIQLVSEMLGIDYVAMLKAITAGQAIQMRFMGVEEQSDALQRAEETEEEKEAKRERLAATRNKAIAERITTMINGRRSEIAAAMEVAEEWANKPDLNHTERVYGAVRDMYSKYGMRPKSWETGGKTYWDDEELAALPGTPGSAFAEAYSERFAKEIAERRMRQAKDLFGE